MAKMGRPAKIWWHTAKGKYYATIRGVKTPLAADWDEAEKLYHLHKSREQAPELRDSNRCRTIVDLYYGYIERHHPASIRMVRHYLESFLQFHGARDPDLRVRELRALHVHQWVNAHPSWGESTQFTAITWLVSALSWAAKPEQAFIDRNPIAGIKRPAVRSRGREAIIAPEDHDALYAAANDGLRDVLFMLYQTGARPGSICSITAAMCDFVNGTITQQKHKTAERTGRDLHIPMTPDVAALLRRLCERYPTGPLFRTRRGATWTPAYLSGCILRLRSKCKLTGHVIAYGYRHTVATDLLRDGQPEAFVAQILGHANTQTLHKHYSHLAIYTRPLSAALHEIRRTSPATAAPVEPQQPLQKTEESATNADAAIADAWDEYFDDE